MEYSLEQIKNQIENQVNNQITICSIKKEYFSTICTIIIDNTKYICKIRERKSTNTLEYALHINQKLCDMNVKIPRIYHMWVNDNTQYIIMEYIEGINLYDYLQSDRRDKQKITKLIKSIAKNMVHLHSIDVEDDYLLENTLAMVKFLEKDIISRNILKQDTVQLVKGLIEDPNVMMSVGYCHGDLNPKNILVSPDGEFISFVDTENIDIDLIGFDLSNIKYSIFVDNTEAYKIFIERYMQLLETMPEKRKIIEDNLTIYNIMYKLLHENTNIDKELGMLREQYK